MIRDKETKAQRAKVTCSTSHSWDVEELGLETRWRKFRAAVLKHNEFYFPLSSGISSNGQSSWSSALVCAL